MKITVSKTAFASELAKLLPFIERKTTIPILSNVLLTASMDTITMSATDLEVSLRVTMPAKVKKEGTCTIPGRKLADCIKKLKTLPDTEITIEMLENNWISLTCGPLTVKLPGMAATNFPSLPKVPKITTPIDTEILSTLIARTRFAISGEESRYTLNGALLVLRPDSIMMVATDGHRLAHIKCAASAIDHEIRTLVPRDTIDRLRSLLDNADSKTVAFASDHETKTLWFEIDGDILTSRELTGQFPNYEQVLPANQPKRIRLAAAAFTEVLTRVGAFASERSHTIRCELLRDGLKLSASSTESGEASEIIPASYDGAPLIIGLNGNYVLDYLKTYKNGAQVEVQFKDEQSSALFVPVDGQGYDFRTVIMPQPL